jgi:poly-gamma-glutamate capsule biosynthesis protein CapA/YwtB (metallophosphatase superfamily)
VSNFPLAYKLSWLPRLLKPSLEGDRDGFLSAEGTLLPTAPRSMRRIAFVGDISAVANRKAPEIDPRLRGLLASADLVVGNCESPVVDRAYHRLGTAAGTRHAMTRRFLAAAIEAAGIAPERLVLSLANNHALDQGVDGFEETREALAGLGIATIGTAGDGLVRKFEASGVRIGLGLAAFTQWRNESPKAFVGRVTMLEDLIANDSAPLRYDRDDLLCVVAHWGYEFRHLPHALTRKVAAALAESGAELVVGHHAHVLQPVERFGDTIVAYGLGDFLGTALPSVPWPLRLGGIFVAEISADQETKGRLAAYRMVPFVRMRAKRHERLVPLEETGGPMGKRMRERFAAIYPPAQASG